MFENLDPSALIPVIGILMGFCLIGIIFEAKIKEFFRSLFFWGKTFFVALGLLLIMGLSLLGQTINKKEPPN